MGASGGPYSLTVGTETPIDAGTGTVAIELINESNYAIQVKYGGGTEWLAAWTGDLFHLPQIGGTGVTVTPFAISNAANPPSAVVLSTLYLPGDKISGTFPYPLNRQTNLGNGSIAANVNSIVNDGNTAPTQVVEATPSGAGSSQLKWNNDGSGIFGGGAGTVDNTGFVTTKAYKASGTHNNGVGNFAYEGGAVSFDSGHIHSTGSGACTYDGILFAPAFTPNNGNGTFNCRGDFSGSVSGTFATGAGQTPTICLLICVAAASSNTEGAVISGTNCVVTQGNSGVAWKGLAI